MNHTELTELYELYVLGVLEPEFAAEIDRHLAEGCKHCRAEVDRAMVLTASLSRLAPVRVPPQSLRERVLRLGAGASSTRKGPARRSWVLPLSLAAAALLLLSAWLGYSNRQLRQELGEVNRERTALEAALKNLGRSETRTVQFGRANQAHGRVFASPANGVVFVGSGLPVVPAGRTFQLWVIPATGGPLSAGTFRADANGSSVQVSPVNVAPGAKAVAVSIEPQGGSPAPTTTPVIVVPLG